MIKTLYRCAIACAAVVALTACSGDDSDLKDIATSPFNIKIDQPKGEYQMDAAGNAVTIKVTANGKWEIVTDSKTNDADFTVEPTSGDGDGTVTITAQQNNTLKERVTKYHVKHPTNINTLFTVTQAAGDVTLSVSPDEEKVFENTTTVQQHTITVRSNAKVTVTKSGGTWLNINKTTLEDIPTDGTTLVVTTDDAPALQDQTATLTFTATGNGRTVTKELKFSRPALAAQVTITPDRDVDYNGGTLQFNITSNTDWLLTPPNADWASFAAGTQLTGKDNATITVTVNPNTTTSERQATITVALLNDNTKLSQVTITQAAGSLPTLSGYEQRATDRTNVTFFYKVASTTFPVTDTWITYTKVSDNEQEPAVSETEHSRHAADFASGEILLTVTGLEAATWYKAQLHAVNAVGETASEPFWFQSLSAPDHGDNTLPELP